MKLVVIVMGSLGSTTMTKKIKELIPKFNNKNYQVLVITGKAYYDDYKELDVSDNVKIVPFMNDLINLLKDSDLIAGLFPCEATEPIIEEACKYDKDFYVAMCGCVHFRNANIPYSESNSRLYQSYVIDLADRLVSNNKELVVDMLDDKYLVPYPIIYTKKK